MGSSSYKRQVILNQKNIMQKIFTLFLVSEAYELNLGTYSQPSLNCAENGDVEFSWVQEGHSDQVICFDFQTDSCQVDLISEMISSGTKYTAKFDQSCADKFDTSGPYPTSQTQVIWSEGVETQGLQIMFTRQKVDLECSHQTTFTATFNFNVIDTKRMDAMHVTNIPSFDLEVFSNENRTVSAAESATSGELVYGTLISQNLQNGKIFMPTICTFSEYNGSRSLELFNSDTDCGGQMGSFLGLEMNFSNGKFLFQYLLFLFSDSYQSSYQLTCEIQICDADDAHSTCNTRKQNCNIL